MVSLISGVSDIALNSTVAKEATLDTLTSPSFSFTISTSAPNQTFSLPLGSSGSYVQTFTANWGDGSENLVVSYNDARITHVYAAAGSYTITMTGVCEYFGFDNAGTSKDMLTALVEFKGDMGFKTLNFNGASNLVTLIPLGRLLSLVDASCLCRCTTSLQSIPAGFLDNVPNITAMGQAWRQSAITAIPSGLLRNLSKLQNAAQMFIYCQYIVQDIDGDMLVNNPLISQMTEMFYWCSGLTGSGWGSGAMPETVQHTIIYNAEHMSVEPIHPGFFGGCTGLTNFNLMPAGWTE